MKFTKEEAREKLMGILTNNGKKPLRMSAESVDSQLEILLPIVTTDDTELDDFVEKFKKTFEVMNSNAEHDNSEFVKEWNESHSKKDEKKDDKKGEQDKKDTSSENDEAIKLLMKRIEDLEKSKQEAELKVTLDSKRGELFKAIESKGVKNKEWADTMIGMVNITADMDVEKEADNCLKLFNLQHSESSDFTPYNSSSGKQNKDLLENVKKYRVQSGLMDKSSN